jgi:ribose transport system ATP-binding protein
LSEALLRLDGLDKRFGATHALRSVDLEVHPGTVHALLGQNGCGKSTLVKSVTGVVHPDAGRILVGGVPVHLPVRDPGHLGIAVVHQDVGLVDSLSVLDNLGVSTRFDTPVLNPIRGRRQKARYLALMEQLGIRVSLRATVADLAPAERSLIGLVRAMRALEDHDGPRLLILDEPTASLSRQDADLVLGVMRNLASLGSSALFITHRLGEVMEVCDTATVMRAGSVVATERVSDVSRADLVSMMLGERMEEFFPRPQPLAADAVERISLSGAHGPALRDVDLSVRSGEVLGVTGLVGMGQDDVTAICGGAEHLSDGQLRLDGTLRRPADAIRRAIVRVPANRLRDAVWAQASAAENATLPVLRRFSYRGTLLRTRGLRARAREILSAVRLEPLRPDASVSSFSGGNQQKIVFAKWMQLEPRVLLLDEPTQGVDPASAKELLTQMLTLASGGAAVVVNSGDAEMLAEVCHRVLVLSHGRVVGEFEGATLTEAALVHAASDSESVKDGRP